MGSLSLLQGQTTQGNRLSCRDQEGRRGSGEAVPGPSVFPSGEPGVSGDFWGSQEGCQGPSRKMDWLDLLAVQGTLKSLLQHHSSKASILWCSAFFTVQLSHPYMTTGKTIALTRRTFVGKVMLNLFKND